MSAILPSGWPTDSDWTDELAAVFRQASFQKLVQRVDARRSEVKVFPDTADVFSAFRLCSFAATKVVVLGQDPYHGDGQAHGLAFSVPDNQPLPPSLRNIFKELKNDLNVDNRTGNLTSWAEQGVLLLNTVLTVERSLPNSHRGWGWESLTDLIIEKLGSQKKSIVFVLWGKPAAGKKKWIGDQHAIIESAHPSPLSAYRGFFGSRPFSRANNWLTDCGYEPIDWSV